MERTFRTEMHLHTCNVSDCAHDTPEHLLETYKAHGYSTIVVTNHFKSDSFTNAAKLYHRNEGKYYLDSFDKGIIERCEKKCMTWEDKVNYFYAGYEYLKKIAPEDMNILFGAEIALPFLNCEYLIYGADREFFLRHPDLDRMNIYDVCRYVHQDGFLIFAAHPFRNWCNVSDPDIMDGIEVFNGAFNHNSRNDLANQWAEAYALLKSSGSDYHDPTHRPDAGILTETPIRSNEQLMEVLRSRQYDLIREEKII